MAAVTIDGSVPADAENESLGASRIRNLAAAINGLFGQGVTFTYGSNPFIVDALGNVTVPTTITVPTPTAAGQAATKAYVDASSGGVQAVYANLTNGGSGNAYTGIGSPVPTAYVPGLLYILQFQQSNPGGPVTINISGLGAITLKKAEDVDLAAGDIPAGGILACFYDNIDTVFQVSPAGGANAAAFQGIGVSSVAPTNGQIWQYNSGTGLWTAVSTSSLALPVNQSVTHDTLSVDVTMTANTDTTVLSHALTMPAAGGPFRVRVDYGLYLNNGANVQWQFYVTDGTAIFASSQVGLTATAAPGGVTGGGYSTVTYANGATPTLTLKARVSSIASGGSTVVHTPAAGAGSNSWFDTAIQESN